MRGKQGVFQWIMRRIHVTLRRHIICIELSRGDRVPLFGVSGKLSMGEWCRWRGLARAVTLAEDGIGPVLHVLTPD
jgi:hypothetical protein